MSTDSQRPPVIVVGAGLAGLSTALHLAATRRVLVLAKGALHDSASARAQGGIVAVLGADDSVEAHVHDTQVAGAGLVDARAAQVVSSASRDAVAWLVEQGVPFTRDAAGPMGLHLTREGGHGVRRIAHADDASGLAIHATLLARAAAHPGITLRDGVMAVDLRVDRGACHGVEVLDVDDRRIETLAASAVVLATGGLGQLYPRSSNSALATGDGVAIAWRAGCRVANMEFIQFHPTCLHHAQDRGFLVTEALRGEGAVLRLPDGTRFMPAHDARAELAPRDIVARAIACEMRRHATDHVLLDATALGEAVLRQRFPTVHARCLALGIDIAREPIPVVPAAHYSCGGVATDLDGRTDLDGLFAVGETACTGLHGANRLASNSLLECVVLGMRCAARIAAMSPAGPGPMAARGRAAGPPVDDGVVARGREAIQHVMAEHAGIVRTTAAMERASTEIDILAAGIEAASRGHGPTRPWLELRNLVACAALVLRSALGRHESRGAHFSSDFPATAPTGVASVLRQTTRIE